VTTRFKRELDLGIESTDAQVAEATPEAEKKAVEKLQFENQVAEEVRLRLEVERAARNLRDEIERRAPAVRKCVHGVPVIERLDAKGVRLNYARCGLCSSQAMTDEELLTQRPTTAFTSDKGCQR
jgi:hypothetical protein